MSALARCCGPRCRGARRTRLSPTASLAIWTALVVVWLLDRGGPHVGQHAAVFALIVAGIEWLATTLAAAAEITVAYLATVVSWLGGHLASLFSNTGAMFSKVWEGAKIVYGDVVKPAIQWLHDTYETIKGWMARVFGPVLEWANRVRTELQSLYKRFVKPILNILDTSRAVLDVLAKLHVPFAATLERYVTDVEHTITENYLRILGYVNDVLNTLNGFFTLDGLLQRFTFIRTLERDAYLVWRVMGNSVSRQPTDDEKYWVGRATVVLTVPQATDDMHAYLKGDESNIGAVVDKYAASWGDYLEGNAGDLGAGVTV